MLITSRSIDIAYKRGYDARMAEENLKEGKSMSNSLKVIPTRTGRKLSVRGLYVGGAEVEAEVTLTNAQVAQLINGLTDGGFFEMDVP